MLSGVGMSVLVVLFYAVLLLVGIVVMVIPMVWVVIGLLAILAIDLFSYQNETNIFVVCLFIGVVFATGG